MRRRRPAFVVLAAVASLAAFASRFAPPSRAEGDDAEIYYDWSTMKLAPDALPEGWKLIVGASDAGSDQRQAIHDAIGESGKEAASDAQTGDAYLQSVDLGDGKVATLALVDVKSKPQAFLAALKTRAEKASWALREMGGPSRLLVVAAPEDLKARVVAVQTTWAGRQLAVLSAQELDRSYPHRALPIARAAIALEPGAAPAHLVLAYLRLREMTRDSKPADWEKTAAEFRAALDEKATIPLSSREAAMARGELGGALLMKKDDAADAEARDALKKAVEGAALLDRQVTFSHRYNLACAHGRLKEVDAAFADLAAVLEEDGKHRIDGIEHWRKDPDFDNLHGDARWAEMTKKYPEASKASGN